MFLYFMFYEIILYLYDKDLKQIFQKNLTFILF